MSSSVRYRSHGFDAPEVSLREEVEVVRVECRPEGIAEDREG